MGYVTFRIKSVVKNIPTETILQIIIKKKGLFIGMKVRCNFCGANKWYSLAELKEVIDCKGCFNQIIPGIKSPIYYKLSETIISNLLSDQTKNKKTFDGNYIVIRTLHSLKNDYSNCYSSFIWVPPTEIVYQLGDDKNVTDIDIIAIQDGKLVLGEAKNNEGIQQKGNRFFNMGGK